MKKFIAISFLAVFLCASTEIHQILRLPVLIQHYLEHQEVNNNQSLAEFLTNHYSNRQNHSDSNHNNLPFKTADCATAHVALAFANHAQYSVQSPTTFQEKASSIYNDVIYSSAIVNSIWQPPKQS